MLFVSVTSVQFLIIQECGSFLNVSFIVGYYFDSRSQAVLLCCVTSVLYNSFASTYPLPDP